LILELQGKKIIKKNKSIGGKNNNPYFWLTKIWFAKIITNLLT